MSLQERVFGLETEYAVNFYPVHSAVQPEPYLLVQALQEAIRRRYGLPGCDFLFNGGKLYHDIGHAEWAIPECISAREAASYDKALDYLLAQALPEAQALLAAKGCEGTLFVAKNNVDSEHNTYGCHENYMMLRDTPLLVDDDFRHYLARCLIPFLVTRQLFTGTGHIELLNWGTSEMRASFVLSQRSFFIESTISQDTRQNRSLIHFGRENEPLAEGNYRRLHLILGDSNLSGWATWIKLGITAIILRMIEDLFLQDVPLLLNPVAALHTIARDPTCNILLPLRNGKRNSARDIQWRYFELASAYLHQFEASPEERVLMEAWGKALEDIDRNPMWLRYGVDWVMKKLIMDTYLEQRGVHWYKARQKAVISELQAQNLRYHDISPGGLFNRFCTPDTLFKTEEIEHALLNPPPYTRARVRGMSMKRAQQENVSVQVKRWMELSVGNQTIHLPDPLVFDQPSLDFDKTWWEQTLAHPNARLRLRAVQQLAWRQDGESLALLMKRVTQETDTQVRRAAIEMLGVRADRSTLALLTSCLDDVDPLIRWAAEEAHARVQKGVPTRPTLMRSSAPGESDLLIQLLT
jgi:proteasome accessory factor A